MSANQMMHMAPYLQPPAAGPGDGCSREASSPGSGNAETRSQWSMHHAAAVHLNGAARPCAGPSPQSQVVCAGCRTLLMFPHGAQNVRCARCGHITAVPPAGGKAFAPRTCLPQTPTLDVESRELRRGRHGTAGVQQPHLSCGAHVPARSKPSAVLHLRHSQLRHGGEAAHHMAPGERLLSCPVWMTALQIDTAACGVQANHIGHLVCAQCHMTLMFAHGAQSVKCAVCNYVTAVTPSSTAQTQQPQRCACHSWVCAAFANRPCPLW